MTRTMYDGVRSLAAGIARQFPNAAMVAGYLNGLYAWTSAEWGLFPHAEHVTISVTASADAGDVLDVERGDATPDQAAGWIDRRKASGLHRPTIYCSRLTIPAVRQATGTRLLGIDYDIWCADYTGSPHEVTAPGVPARLCAATQYESTPGWDASAVYDDGWPHRAAPVPPQPPTTTVEVDVKLDVLRQGSTGQQVANWQGLLVAHALGYLIANAAGKDVMERAGVDGQFGRNTHDATVKFQEDRKLTPTGVVGAAEWTAALA